MAAGAHWLCLGSKEQACKHAPAIVPWFRDHLGILVLGFGQRS